MPQPWSIYEGLAEHATAPIGKLSRSRLLARAGVRVNSNRTTSTAPIQYP
jgi:hypothetical protein